ncbi:calponin homology domain-containing protein DDB_G0272472-like [Sardina pilchardus]|uniref:calponin homology domain-containing protein DDB_G0272472-like n=1 Tax=Sardina pilchardus TaxID=27697 RepID=UPI002E0E685F
MYRLSKGLRASLRPAKVYQLQQHVADMAEKARLKELVMGWKAEKLTEDIAKAEQTLKVVAEENQRERERKEAGNGAPRSDEEEKTCVTLSLMTNEKSLLTEKIQMCRQNFVSLEEEYQRIVSLLETVLDYDQIVAEHIKVASENWARLGQERVDGALSAALTAATIKQKWLKDLKGQAEKRMAVSDGPAQEVSDTKNHDGLQCLSFSSQRTEQIIVRNQTLQGQITAKSEKKMARLMAVAAKKEEKIRAAELKKRRQLEEKTRKELEKVNKAELKKKKRREAKEKKEAEQLERKRAKEERKRAKEEMAETRQPRCCFCCFC